MTSLFEIEDVHVQTTDWVRSRAQRGCGGWIYGFFGSGKSHAVRAAALRALSIDLVPGPLLGQRFASDLARQIGTRGKPLLEAAKRRGFSAALGLAEEVVNGHPLVVDVAEQLLVEPINLDEPATALWQEDKNALREWLVGRLERSPTFLISRRNPGDQWPGCRHVSPGTWPIKLRWTQHGYRDWSLLGELGRDNPGVFVLARALVGLIHADAFNELLKEAEDDSVDVAALLQRLGHAFMFSAPASWQRALALLDALGSAPRDAVEFVLGSGVGVDAEAHDPMAEEALAALDRLQELALVEERAGRISVLPVLSKFGVRALTGQERSELLPKLAHHLLAPVNNLQNLEPDHADRVILAHSIFVEVGNFADAERTAVLHVHGLVDLARRTSLNERFADAWQQYDSVLRMLSSSGFGVEDLAGQRLRSYVQHYRAWNGFKAGALDNAACLPDYQQACDGWPKNALWHQRVIQTLVRLGRLVEAEDAVKRGYEVVEDHPRRDELLRVRPARTALHANALRLSLELIEPTLDASPDLFPEVVRARDTLLRRWEHGLRCDELAFRFAGSGAEGRVKLLQPAEVRIRRSAKGWSAQTQALPVQGHADTPGTALDELARNLAEEARRLIATATWKLNDKEIRRKGLLLSYVDALNSDIGLHHTRDRWIVGRIEDTKLIPTMRHLPPIELPPEVLPETTDGLYFVRVPVHRDGVPSGQAEAVEPAGSGFGYGELVKLLARMNEGAE